MRRLLSAVFVAGLLVAACGGGSASAPAKPPATPGPVVKYKNMLPGQTAAAPIDLIQSIIDFAPGAASVVHTHTSPNLGTVLQGQVTVKTPSGDKQASAGDMLVEPLNQAVQAFNLGPAEAMVAVAYSVPHGSKASAPVAGQPAPATPNKTLYSSTLASPGMGGGYTLIQQVLDFAPGSQTRKHRHGGPGIITVIQGQVTLSADGVEKTYNVGDSFTETPGQTLQAFNRGSTELVVVGAYLVPDGALLTTNL